MNRAGIVAELRGFLRDDCYLDDAVGDDEPLFSSSLLSSLDFIDLVAFLEERFGIQIDASDAGFDNLDTISKVVRLVEERGAVA